MKHARKFTDHCYLVKFDIIESLRNHTCAGTYMRRLMLQVHVDQSRSLYLALFELTGKE